MLRVLSLLVLSGLLLPACLTMRVEKSPSAWPVEAQRVWIGPDYWANPLQDWCLNRGRLECAGSGGNRNVHLLTRAVTADPGDLDLEVRLGRLTPPGGPAEKGWVGFKVGIRGSFADYRDSAVHGQGLHAGLDMGGRLFIGHLQEDAPVVASLQDIRLRFEARTEGATCCLILSALDGSSGEQVVIQQSNVDPAWLTGGLALVCSAKGPRETPIAMDQELRVRDWGGKPNQGRGGEVRFWFQDWIVGGSKVADHPERAYGPVFFSLYTLSEKVLKLTAQMPPVGNGSREVFFETREGDTWKTLRTARIDPLARTATFRIENWEDGKDTPYRLRYRLEKDYYYTGTIRKNPVDQDAIVVAAFTGNHDFGFPAKDIVHHVRHHNPDLLVFTGDQVYEPCGGYGIQRTPVETAALDYLRKWYIYGWAFGELLRDRPTICLPDDHDVYQGNIWGAGGRHAEPPGAKGQDQGGYVMAPHWVNMVHRTQTSHLPDPFDPTPIEQEISVYYGALNLGGVSFAFVADRMWKSAPALQMPSAEIWNGWAQNPDYDAARDGDPESAVLLGPRQLDFLNHWSEDFGRGIWMKCLLSQTIFANLATLPFTARSDAVTHKLKVFAPGEYPEGEKIVQDHDSNGWPRSGRNRALRLLRKAFALHIAGDQHLASTLQYGIDDFGDAGFAICVPSVANIFPRRWFPPHAGHEPLPGQPAYTGDFRDGFGNPVTVHAVSNPCANDIAPTALNHRAPGYGIVTFKRMDRQIELANWPRWVDPSQKGAEPYPGWPVTFEQTDNFPQTGSAALPNLVIQGCEHPVVQLVNEDTGEVIYTLRVEGLVFQPGPVQPGTYTLRIGEPGTSLMKVLSGVRAKAGGAPDTVTVQL